MKEFTFTVTDPLGLHARPAGILVKESGRYASSITVTRGAISADAGRIFALMKLGAKRGDTLTVTVHGEDEDAAAEGIKSVFTTNL